MFATMNILFVSLIVLCSVKAHKQNSSVAFVIDITSSMSKEIEQVRNTTDKVFDSVIVSKTNNIDSVILVTFDDPNVQECINTRNREEFKKALSKIKLVSGGDCPEFVIPGIERAVRISRPNSFIYVFTDASAKDLKKVSVVKSLCQKKSIQINFLLTGKCKKSPSKYSKVYEELAQATSGNIFNINKDDVAKVIDLVTETLKTKRTTLKRNTIYSNDQKVQFTIDSKMSKVYIYVTSESNFTILNSKEVEVTFMTVLRTEKEHIVRLNKEESGDYFVKLYRNVKTVVTITASTMICFQHGFSTILPQSLDETSIKPNGNITDKYYLSILLDNDAKDVSLKTVEFIDEEDIVVDSFELKLINKNQQFYVTSAVLLNNVEKVMFRIAIVGLHTHSKENIKRITVTSIEFPKTDIEDEEEPTKMSPEVKILNNSKIFIDYNDSISIKCKVSAVPKPNIYWKDSYGKTIQPDNVVMKLDAPSYLSILNIAKVDENGSLTCNAENKEGNGTDTITLEIKQKFYMSIVNYPKDTTVPFEKSHKFKCNVNAYPAAETSWYIYKNTHFIEISDNEDYSISLDNTTLTIKQMSPKLDGTYVVNVSNKFKNENFTFHVTTEIELPKINKIQETYTVRRGSSENIYCRIIQGKPEPKISWSYKKLDQSTFENLATEKDNKIELIDINESIAGYYMCKANNEFGHDEFIMTVYVEYAPAIKNKVLIAKYKLREKVMLTCNVIGYPYPKVKWLINTTEIEVSGKYKIFKNNSLSFIVSTFNDGGNYKCNAENKLGTANNTIEVSIIEPVRIEPPNSSNITEFVGRPLTLSCEAHGVPKPTIQWLQSSYLERQTVQLRGVTNTIEIKQIQIRDEGIYICIADNGYGKKNISIYVNVNAAPTISHKEKVYETVVGDLALKIPCVTLASPKADIQWEYSDKSYKIVKLVNKESDDYKIDRSGTLILYNIKKKFAGFYTCKAVNLYGNDSFRYNITVTECPVPKAIDLIKAYTIELGSQISLIAIASVSNNANSEMGNYYVRWYKDGTSIKNCSRNTSCDWVLSNVTAVDSGVYTRRFSSMAYSATYVVTLGFCPHFNKSEVTTTIPFKVNYSAQLDCSSWGEQPLQVDWFLNLQKLPVNFAIYTFNIKSNEEIGLYECKIRNRYGLISRKFNITGDLDCDIEIPFHRNMPLFSNKEGLISESLIRKNQKIIITCNKSIIYNSNVKKFPSPLKAVCLKNTIFKTEYGDFDILQLKCEEPVELEINEQSEQCTSKHSKWLQVGFQVDSANIAAVFSVCLDINKNIPKFITYKMDINIANKYPKTEIKKFIDSNKLPFNFNDFYDCKKQLKSIEARTGVRISEDNKCCFSKNLLVHPADLKPGLSQIAPYSYLNVIPQWSTCSRENWDEVGRRVRSLISSRQLELNIVTGTSGFIKLKHSKIDSYVILNDRNDRVQRVPLYIWKVIISHIDSKGLAIITKNVPNLHEDTSPLPCTDICHKVKWMNSSQWHDSSKGFVFCCEPKAFQKAFHYANLFRATDLLN